ncbi:sulfotransferase family protein [Nocardioides mangrovi]|uniref:Sulfotransferase n=1 Tax=Nocardioides mangrovi TaxID=2874580 RepID=A0ABS7UC91_9ACTN|nr:sulfotransferase [Nocardioides mangrovi]MBZ5738610.1 sulfotransferase [Nocardioides mangrovi]
MDPEELIAAARAKEGLEDYGPGDFREPLGVLAAAYDGAGLNEVGRHLIRGGLVHSLRMRLRAQEWFRRHPEIAEEVVTDPVVVVGMMRSGTTLVQRLLAADTRFRCARGWEVVEVAPALDQRFDVADPRIAKAQVREEQSRQWVPELYAIHPMHALEAEEEIVFLADAFLSHVPESGADVPDYRRWLDDQDLAPAYDHLHRMLQLLQWQQRQREEAARETAARWVLKTPAHLGYLDDLRRRFPDLHVVHLHRDPVETVASGASLNATLHRMHADVVDDRRIGREWLERMAWTDARARASERRWPAGLVTHLDFADVVADPVGQISQVYDAIGLELTADAVAAMEDWLERRPREAGRPAYMPEDYGLTPELIRARFPAG